ncbi:hypothetical protein L6164_005959 [Bauhinia variegata]|uniref:Uncharacterized protein n=1 Tax=Bauhinia variegata TaxID=167791 RepID=A0ACB9PTE4_BAUVA|nr:hypothetical protein L6164_005959 [Bauhinia variegata]
MGCAGSKQKRCRHCKAPYSPVPRSYSIHAHHPPQEEGNSYHVVALTSTTLGSLRLDSKFDSPVSIAYKLPENKGEDSFKFCNGNGGFQFSENNKPNEFSMGIIEAKTWSEMIEQKIPKSMPKTPTRTPPGEPETINTWELMEGLEDASPFRSPSHFRSFSFDVHRHPASLDQKTKSNLAEDVAGPPPPPPQQPIWHQIREEESNLKAEISDFNPEVISMFKKSLEELSPESPFHLRRVDHEKQHNTAPNSLPFDIPEEKRSDGGDAMNLKSQDKERVVVYFTSLRGVRKTYEDCCHVRVILKSLGIRVDERDVSMHSAFKDELKELLDDGYFAGGLPRVFLGRNCIGGVEEIKKLHDDGQLEKLLQSCEKLDIGNGEDGNGVCGVCGDIRFVPCETCSGSCKIYYEGNQEEEEEDEDETGECGFQRCPDCNENGLIRCPICHY